MFRKLLKYDFRAVGRIWWIAALGVLGISVVGGLSLTDIILHAEDLDYFPIGILGILFTYFGFVAFSLITWILLFVRYYKNFFTDEGYLTFTLPVTRTQLYLSKTVNAMIWNTLTLIVIVVGVIIVLVIAPAGEHSDQNVLAYLFSEVKKTQVPAYTNVGAWPLLWIAEASVIIFLSALSSVMFIELCITIGSVIAKKAKALVAIAIAYGSSIVFSVLYYIVSFSLPFWVASVNTLYPGALANGNSLFGLISLGLLLLCVVFAVALAAIYLLTVTCLERKLNLA